MRVPEIVEKLWEKYGPGENVRKHCIAVAEMALKITESVERRDTDQFRCSRLILSFLLRLSVSQYGVRALSVFEKL